jgi:hypothetical protein
VTPIPRRPSGGAAGFGAVAGLVCAALLIVLPVALSATTDARNVEWLGNILFVGLPLVLLGALAGAVIGGRRLEPRARRRRTVAAAVGVVAVVLFVLTGTTSLIL